MSGLKKTPLEIAQDDIRSLRSDLSQSRAYTQQAVNSAIAQSQRQHQQDIQRVQQDNQQRENRLQNQIGSLNNEITRTWQQHRQAMAEQNQTFQNQMQEQSHEFHNHLQEQSNTFFKELKESEQRTHSEMQGMERRTNKQLTDLRIDMTHAMTDLAQQTQKALKAQNDKFDKITQEQQQQINAARKDINGILNRETDAYKKATMLAEALDNMITTFEKDTWFQKFGNKALADIKRQVQHTKKNGNHAYSNVALFQQQLFALQTLEEKVEDEARRFQAFHSLVWASANTLLNTMKANRENTHFLETDGSKGAKVEVDFWTYGKYSELSQAVETIKERLETDKHKPHFDEKDLQELLNRLSDIDKEQSELVNLAIQRGNASHIRAEMADMIIETFQQQGFDIVKDKEGDIARNYMGSSHQAKDQRAGYYVILRNSSGTEISVVIEPDENLIKNELIINTKSSGYYNEAAACKRVEDLNESLREAGLKVGRMTAPQHGHLEELYDVNALKKKGLDTQTKKKLKI